MLAILQANGFTIIRQNGTSHRQLRGLVDGEVRMTTPAGKPSDEIAIGTLQAIVRQSGLPRRPFSRSRALQARRHVTEDDVPGRFREGRRRSGTRAQARVARSRPARRTSRGVFHQASHQASRIIAEA